MLLAENLLLLVTDDASGRLRVPTDQLDPALAGANLVELTMMGRVDLSGAGGAGKPGRLIVCDASPAGDEVLDAALPQAPGSGVFGGAREYIRIGLPEIYWGWRRRQWPRP
jgi:Golgi phosphoprotein 3 (GPP34)